MTQVTVRDALISTLHLEGCEGAERDTLLQEFTETIVNNTLTDLVLTLEPSEIDEIQKWLEGTSSDDVVAFQKKFGSKMKDFLILFNKQLHDAIREIEHSTK